MASLIQREAASKNDMPLVSGILWNRLLSEMKLDVSDPMAIGIAKDTLKALEGQREVVFAVKRADEVRGELTTALGEQAKLEAVVKKLTKEVPEDLITKAKLPVEGLSLSGDDVLINGVNLDNLSSCISISL